MAKVTGPLMSLEASGTYAGALTFAKWKGRPYVRLRVDPANPDTLEQADVRNAMRVAAAGVRWANVTLQHQTGEADLDKVKLRDAAPTGQAWNGWLTKNMIGPGSTFYNDSNTRYAALTAPQKAAWQAAAVILNPPMTTVQRYLADHVESDVAPAGEVFFHYAAGLARAGALSVPLVDAVPVEYDPA